MQAQEMALVCASVSNRAGDAGSYARESLTAIYFVFGGTHKLRRRAACG